jgi:hypothetical protein
MKEIEPGTPRHSSYEFNVGFRVGQDGNVEVEVRHNGKVKSRIANWWDAPSAIATSVEDHLVESGERRAGPEKKPTRVVFEDVRSGVDTFPFSWLHRIFGSGE